MNFALLLSAILAVESPSGQTRHDGGDGAGRLAIHRAVVADVNAAYNATYQWPADCYDLATATTICRLYLTRWHALDTYEHAARTWNGGPQGHKRASTLAYWKKVEKRINAGRTVGPSRTYPRAIVSCRVRGERQSLSKGSGEVRWTSPAAGGIPGGIH